jgi:dCTP deaminase
MAFWSAHTLRSRLAELIDKPDPGNIDCAAYTLTVGSEYYVTPTDGTLNASATTLQTLPEGRSFAVPPGQFGYVLTQEIVRVPTSAIAFISIRARIKWRGLVNVSGFHVDPGFEGRLLFAVYNAGPVPIHLRRGDPTFLIWFADLDHGASASTKPADTKQGMAPITRIDTAAINQVSGVIYSVHGLADKIRAVEKDLGSRITALERENGIIKVIAAALLAILVTLAGEWLVKEIFNTPASTIGAGAGTLRPHVAPPTANPPPRATQPAPQPKRN